MKIEASIENQPKSTLLSNVIKKKTFSYKNMKIFTIHEENHVKVTMNQFFFFFYATLKKLTISKICLKYLMNNKKGKLFSSISFAIIIDIQKVMRIFFEKRLKQIFSNLLFLQPVCIVLMYVVDVFFFIFFIQILI